MGFWSAGKREKGLGPRLARPLLAPHSLHHVGTACWTLGTPSIRHTSKRFRSRVTLRSRADFEDRCAATMSTSTITTRLSCTLQGEAEPGQARAGELLAAGLGEPGQVGSARLGRIVAAAKIQFELIVCPQKSNL